MSVYLSYLPSSSSHSCFRIRVWWETIKINGCILFRVCTHCDPPKIWFAFEKCMKIKKLLILLTDKMIDSILLVSFFYFCFIFSLSFHAAAVKMNFSPIAQLKRALKLFSSNEKFRLYWFFQHHFLSSF